MRQRAAVAAALCFRLVLMLWFILRKLAGFLATVLVTCAVVFACLSSASGVPAPPDGFVAWVGRFLLGDFGV